MSIVAKNEADILTKLISPDRPGLSPEAARSILALSFDTEDVERMNALSAKANEGSLTEQEQQELDSYERVGHLLAIFQSKARTSLKAVSPNAES